MPSAYTYVLPWLGEAIMKIGFTRDPLQRFEQFHPRWFDLFDLDDAFLVESGGTRDARDLETRLKREAVLHNAPAPLGIVEAAGGFTEWYRGAYASVRDHVEAHVAAMGHVLHAPLRDWYRDAMQARTAGLFEWSAQVAAVAGAEFLDTRDDADARRFRAAVRTHLDAFAAAGIDTDALLAPAFVQRMASLRAR